MDKDKALEVIAMIRDDVKNDARNFDGKPFSGKTVAEYFGNHGAAIEALANIVGLILKKEQSDE